MFALGDLCQVGAALHRGESRTSAAERVGRHQAVTSTVPAGAIPIVRVIQNREADHGAIDRAGIVTPCGLAPPATRLTDLPVRVLDLAVACLLSDRIVNANAERAFLGVAKRYRTRVGTQIDVEHQEPCVAKIDESDGAMLVEDFCSVRGTPLVIGFDM